MAVLVCGGEGYVGSHYKILYYKITINLKNMIDNELYKGYIKIYDDNNIL